jgi:penicillin-binding protein 1A
LEAALSFRIETELDKTEILECYVNRIYFGSGCYGIETAARTYFSKPAAKLTLSEAALLAGLIRSPTRLSPLNNPDGAMVQRDVVLERLLDLGWISPAEKSAALAEPLRLSPRPQPAALQENWAMDAIRRELESILPRVGFDTGELKIYSTIQADLQAVAEKALRSRLESYEERFPELRKDPPLEAAAFFMDHRDGAVRAIVGGRDYSRSKFHRVYFGHRQAGSVVKSFVYALAWSRGLERRAPIENSRLQPGELQREFSTYNPSNADGNYEGPRPAEEGLIFSRNTMSVRVGQKAGFEAVARLLRQSGISVDPKPFPSIVLGAFETTLRDLVSAYTAFSNGGNQVQPYLIRRVTDAQGRVLYQHRQVRTPLLEPRAAEQTREVLVEVLVRGTGAGMVDRRLRGRAGGKTGTTNDFQDAWFVGFYGNLTGGVWVGFDTPQSMGGGAGGAQLALPIWSDVMISPSARSGR